MDRQSKAAGAAERELPAIAPLLDHLLGPLHMHFRSARIAYRDYLDGGRSFLWASSLKRINSAARLLLMTKGYLLPEELQEDAAALVRHYDAWLTLWEEHADRTQPRPGDPFIFENQVTYPREAEERLERLYETLRSDARL